MAATEDSVRGEEAKRGAAILGAQVAFVGLRQMVRYATSPRRVTE